MTEKPKLLWHSNAPHAGTGYATQTALFALQLKERYNLAISAFWGLEGGVVPWNGIPVLPAAGPTSYGNDTIGPHSRMFFGEEKPFVVTLMDVWVLKPEIWGGMNVASWAPVDHSPAPDPVVSYFHHSGAVPIAMAKFGEKMLRDAGLDPLYVPHAIDTKVYRPHDRAEARKALGLDENAYIVGMVAANKGNPSRKCFAEAIQAFKFFHDRHPEARLYLHTEATGMFGGVNLPQLIHSVDLDPEAVIFSDQYRVIHFPTPAEKMGQLFSSFDVLLAASAGEGFGIPVIEAQACGVPVIVSDFSAQPELVGAGWLVDGVKTYTPIGSWQFRPAVEDILDALVKCYRRTDREVEDAAYRAREKALEYDIARVMEEHMLPVLAECERRFKAREPQELRAAA